jgi:hypothetical protein
VTLGPAPQRQYFAAEIIGDNRPKHDRANVQFNADAAVAATPGIPTVTTMLSLKMFVLPLLALIVIASLPRQSETPPAPAQVACAATLSTDAHAGRRQATKPPCEPGRGQLALARTN